MTRMKLWTDLLAPGVGRNKTDRQPKALCLELWRQLKLGQQFTKCGKHPQQEIRAVQLKDCMTPKDVTFDDALFCLE